MHTCLNCGGWSRHYVTKHFGKCSEQLPFCNQSCEQQYFTARLNHPQPRVPVSEASPPTP